MDNLGNGTGMIRISFAITAFAVLTACSDGRGTQYSSARAQVDAPAYIPVTPGATPILTNDAAPLASATPVSQAPLAGPAPTQPVAQSTLAPIVLTEPIAVTPGAVPIQDDGAVVTQAALVTTPLDVTAQAPAQSLKPQTAPRGQTQPQPRVIQASAPAAVATQQRAPTTGRRYARGPIYSACRSAGRREATDRRCGCVQWVADRELTASQQKRGAGYFNNQQGVQDARQSDQAADERFWTAWKAFGQSAGGQCQST